ncbi:hypothetical protein BC332_01999 [Capsicum chinense]|nr:hypothetical protein BC332_01999 [Capsicum chinense]
MGDHVVEFKRILDYKDELLRTNPGTSCVVKLGEANEEGHNKRSCPHRAPSAEPTAPAVATTTGSGRGRGRPKKTPTEATNVAPQGKMMVQAGEEADQRKLYQKHLMLLLKEKVMVQVGEEADQKSHYWTSTRKKKGDPKRIISVGATATSLPTTPPVPTIFPASSSAPPDFCTLSSIAGTKKRGMGSGRGNTAPFKRQRVVEMGMPSSKIYSTGQAKMARSTDVTGDIGYTPSSTSKIKWNEKSAISTRKLQELKENRRKKKVESSSNHPS